MTTTQPTPTIELTCHNCRRISYIKNTTPAQWICKHEGLISEQSKPCSYWLPSKTAITDALPAEDLEITVREAVNLFRNDKLRGNIFNSITIIGESRTIDGELWADVLKHLRSFNCPLTDNVKYAPLYEEGNPRKVKPGKGEF